MAEDDITNKKIAQECGRDFSRKRAIAFPMHVLSAYLNVLRIAEGLSHFSKRSERRNNYNVHVADVAQIEQQRFNKPGGFRLGHVHFPISGDDFLTHQTNDGAME